MGAEQRSISEIYDEYIDILIEGYAYYVPKEIMSDFLLEHIGETIEDDFYDVAHVVVKGSFGHGEITEFQLLQLEKVKRLEHTFFELLGLERNISEKEFQFLILKYMDYVEFLTSIAKWLAENLDTYFEVEGDMKAYGIFGTQFNQFTVHFLELYEAFGEKYKYVISEYYSIEEFVGKYLPDFSNRYKKIADRFPFEAEVNPIFETSQKSKSKSTKRKNKKEKLQLITEEEADLFLLETVFNVKFDK